MLETRLSAILAPELVFLGVTEATLTRVIEATLPIAMDRARVPPAAQTAILHAIDERERSASTIAPPLALPHARHAAAPAILATLVINREGVLPSEGVRIVVPFVTPERAATEHLRFLSGTVKLFRSRDVFDELLDARSADEVLDILRSRGN
jgi:mannitol/fructose-specific phosphotransferase system IIA component (Ntr-type)